MSLNIAQCLSIDPSRVILPVFVFLFLFFFDRFNFLFLFFYFYFI